MNSKNSFDKPMRFEAIGYWSEIKLEILKAYAQEYTKILSKQRGFQYVYIDAFAGAGKHLSRTTGEFVPGSPLNALRIKPGFNEYHLIDIQSAKTDTLRELVHDDPRVRVYEGDCNEILLREVFPQIKYEDFRRGLCFLDPYGLHLDWRVIEKAGNMGTIDILLNFPIMDMNRNVFWNNPEGVRPSDIERMNRFWGDESWRDDVYDTERDLFGKPEKVDAKTITEAFQRRLHDVAGFSNVPAPIPLHNSKGIPLYYLFFASSKQVAERIAKYIFRKYHTRGRSM